MSFLICVIKQFRDNNNSGTKSRKKSYFLNGSARLAVKKITFFTFIFIHMTSLKFFCRIYYWFVKIFATFFSTGRNLGSPSAPPSLEALVFIFVAILTADQSCQVLEMEINIPLYIELLQGYV